MDAVHLLVHAIGRADAGPYPVLLAAHDLVDDLGIGHVRAGHRHHVEQAVADRVARGGDIRDARGVKNRQLRMPAEGADPRQERRQRLGHARHVVLGERDDGIHPAEDAVEDVHQSLALEDRRDLQTVLEAEAVLARLVDDEAHADDHLVAEPAPDLLVDHETEAHAVFHRAAEAVGAEIGARGKNWPMRWPPVSVSTPSRPPSRHRSAAAP